MCWNIYCEYSFNGLKKPFFLTMISLKESCIYYILMVWFYISKQNKYSYLQKWYELPLWIYRFYFNCSSMMWYIRQFSPQFWFSWSKFCYRLVCSLICIILLRNIFRSVQGSRHKVYWTEGYEQRLSNFLSSCTIFRMYSKSRSLIWPWHNVL